MSKKSCEDFFDKLKRAMLSIALFFAAKNEFAPDNITLGGRRSARAES